MTRIVVNGEVCEWEEIDPEECAKFKQYQHQLEVLRRRYNREKDAIDGLINDCIVRTRARKSS